MENLHPDQGPALQPHAADRATITETYPWYPLGWVEKWRQNPEDKFSRQMGLMYFQYPTRMNALLQTDHFSAEQKPELLQSEDDISEEDLISESTLNKQPESTEQQEVITDNESEESTRIESGFGAENAIAVAIEDSETEIIAEEEFSKELEPEQVQEIPQRSDSELDNANTLNEVSPSEVEVEYLVKNSEPLPEAQSDTPTEEDITEPIDDKQVPEIQPDAELVSDEEPAKPASIPGIMPLAESESGEEELTFQPYHTVDYFASQGFRVDNQLPPVTRFDRQLRSFTDWLRTMKPIESAAEPDADEKRIPQMAEASNKQQEVITEPMAEVLLKQGKKAQAKAIFEKLSLLHPEKSSYFAARIKELNN